MDLRSFQWSPLVRAKTDYHVQLARAGTSDQDGQVNALSLSEVRKVRRFANAELQGRADQNQWSEYRLQFLVKDGDVEVGFLSFDLIPGESHLILCELWVERSKRRRGFGRRILALAESVTKDRGITSLLIRPGQLIPEMSEDALRAWYMSQGYEPWPRDASVLEKLFG